MPKLYTLKECFEACGSKLPFTVDWYLGEESPLRRTFHREIYENNTLVGFGHKGHEMHNHYIKPYQKYDYKLHQYIDEFKEMLKK